MRESRMLLSAPFALIERYMSVRLGVDLQSVGSGGLPLSFALPHGRWLLRHPWLRSLGGRRAARTPDTKSGVLAAGGDEER